jgi:hypothetical protein
MAMGRLKTLMAGAMAAATSTGQAAAIICKKKRLGFLQIASLFSLS